MMDISKIKTADDFEALSEIEKFELKSEYPNLYGGLFLNNGHTTENKYLEPDRISVFDWKQHTAELNFMPSDIVTPDDFEKLTDAGKMYLKQQFPAHYSRIFNFRH
jgi:phenylacetate-coenzyme A ligase PaaK-like adenylate-forming protein